MERVRAVGSNAARSNNYGETPVFLASGRTAPGAPRLRSVYRNFLAVSGRSGLAGKGS